MHMPVQREPSDSMGLTYRPIELSFFIHSQVQASVHASYADQSHGQTDELQDTCRRKSETVTRPDFVPALLMKRLRQDGHTWTEHRQEAPNTVVFTDRVNLGDMNDGIILSLFVLGRNLYSLKQAENSIKSTDSFQSQCVCISVSFKSPFKK